MKTFNITSLILIGFVTLILLLLLFEMVYIEVIHGEIGFGGLVLRVIILYVWLILAGLGSIYWIILKLKKQKWQGLVKVNSYLIFTGLSVGACVMVPFLLQGA